MELAGPITESALHQTGLFDGREDEASKRSSDATAKRLIELPGSLAFLDDIAEAESWRKEIHRPIYHLHKWWAQRLGSVFRGLVIASLLPPGESLSEAFYSSLRFPTTVVFDPFMGSGTSLGEARKLGCTVVGQDINPVACAAVTSMFSLPKRNELVEAFQHLATTTAPGIIDLYRCVGGDGRPTVALYYFWVKTIACPNCSASVRLFSSYVFAKHAYPHRHPGAKALCQKCGAINNVGAFDETLVCQTCEERTRLHSANRARVDCEHCGKSFAILEAIDVSNGPPGHEMYAKMVLAADGSREYCRIDPADRRRYDALQGAAKIVRSRFEKSRIEPGYNTNQVLRYGYTHWHQFFNDRQLIALARLADAIGQLQDERIRRAFGVLFSGSLEFNNMFASYKGEGTGAVRHMFSQNKLKPERMPLEANVWGLPQSSGSFSTLFNRRLLKAVEYAQRPWEIRQTATGKVERIECGSQPLHATTIAEIGQPLDTAQVYLNCGDSSKTKLQLDCVDLILTDPPFFDNVHYSELADFFWTWQREIGTLGIGCNAKRLSTRTDSEVQNVDGQVFARRLTSVFRECHRVLKPDGLLVFTFHHSSDYGWIALDHALFEAGFHVVQSHSVKSEMSVASPKRQSHAPIDRDLVIVARKRGRASSQPRGRQEALTEARRLFEADLKTLAGRNLPPSDLRNLYASKLLMSAAHAGFEDRERFLVEALGAPVTAADVAEKRP